MNNRFYRLVFNRLRGMLIAVAETAAAQGKAGQGETSGSSVRRCATLFRMRHAAFAALALWGLAPVLSGAQVVPSGAHAPGALNTANGIQQVNITKPSGAGVSLNTYSQFDVPRAGVILNNSPTLVQTQQAGYINGNPNFGAGDAARIIVNQVNSSNPSQLRGYVEVAGQKTATVVIANSSGLVVDGGGFINTTRGILTTGNPVIDASGNLTGFNVTQGTITVQGAGFNASNIDEVDLLSRAVQANAAVYGNTLHVVTGANSIDYASLNPTPIAGSGGAPGVSVDVAQLGGMYANRIVLVGTENGVGVANAGTIAAQAGDLTLTSAGQLVQSGTMEASGNIGINAASVVNAGTVYAQQSTTIGSAGAVTNSGTLAAQQNTSINAGSVNSTGTLGAGVNGDGTVGSSGDLTVSASGQVSATRLNVAGGNASFSGSGVSVAGSETAANGNVSLGANAGDLNLAGATTSAGGSVNAQASGTLINDRGSLTAGGGATLVAGSISNQGGSVSAQGTLTAQASGQIANQGGEFISQGAMQVRGGSIANNQGTMQSAAGLSVAGASLDNTAGRITSLNGEGLTVTTTGALTNAGGTTATGAQGGVIGGNGAVTLQGGSIVNHGAVSARTNLQVTGQSLDNSNGSLQATGNATVNAGAQLTNRGGTIIAGQAATVSATTLDNSAGTTQASQVSLDATNLVNHGGTITQTGSGPMNVAVSGTLDNSAGGTIQTNSTDLTLTPSTLDNDGGTITHAGTGRLTLAPRSGTTAGAGSISNVGGKVISAGKVVVQAGSLDNATGVLAAKGNITAAVAGGVNNTRGVVRSLSSLSLTSGGALTNANGEIQSGTGAAGASSDTSTLAVQAASVDDTGGLIGNLGTGNTTVNGGSQIVNTNGVIAGSGNVAVNASSISNTQGGQVSGANVTVQANTLDNTAGKIGTFAASNGWAGDVTITTTGAVIGTNGQIGAAHNLTVDAATLTGGGAYSAANDVAVNVQGNFALTSGFQFSAGHDLAFTLPGTFTNAATLAAANNLDVNASDINNSGSMMAGGTLTTHSSTLENSGAIVGGSVSLNATSTIANIGPGALIGATDRNGTLELLAPDIENRDDTTATDTQATTAIYGLGKVVLAGGKDASGNYTNANLIDNVSALIQSAGDMALHANQVTNTRRVMTTSGGYTSAVDPALLAQLGISLSGCTAAYMAACGPGNPQVRGIEFNPTASDYNPAVIAALQAGTGGMPTNPPHGGQWNSTYQYTTYTGVALGNLVTGISPQAQIISGGNLNASSVGTFGNYWSAVAAAGNIAAPVSLDQNSWHGQMAPGVQVTYSGQYHYDNYDNTEYNWQLPFGNAGFVTGHPGGYTQAAPADVHTYALPSYESSFVAGGTLSGTGVSINNTAGNAGLTSLGLVAGQSVAAVNIGTSSVQGHGGLVNPVIAAATAVNVLSNLTIPQGGLFRRDTAPNAPYLIESNPAFTSQKSFISSDYFLNQLGYNPQTVEKRLGDGMYEQQLVQNQVTSLTGKAVPGPYTDTQSMYEAMMASGAALSKQLELPLGMALSADQVAALTSNVVILQTEVVDGQSVLVPVVYLAKASQQNMQGPLIAATDIDLQNAQTFSNSGTVQASNSLTIEGKSIDNTFGTLKSGGLMSLTTTGDVNFTSATVNAGSVALNAGGNLLLDTATSTVNQVSASGATRTTTTLGPIANLNVAGNAAIVTGGNFEQNAGNLNVGGALGMSIGGNWDLGSVQTGEHKVVARANGVSNTDFNTATGSTVKVGGVSEIGVGGNLSATGANINLGGGGVIAAKGDVTLQAAKATSTVDSNSSGSDHHGSYSESLHTSDDTLTATTLNAGNSLTVASGNNLNLTGSTINLDKGTATLAAAGNVNIGAATETNVDNSQETHSHSEVVSSKSVSSGSSETATYSQGSTVSADGVAISSGKDINVAGSTIVGTNDVSLSAVHDVNITTSQDTQSSQSYSRTHESGFLSGLNPINQLDGGLQGYSVGTRTTQETQQSSQVTNNASTVGSLNGNLSIQAGNTLHVTGSDLVAAENVTGTAANVIIDAATDTAHEAQQQKTSSTAITAGLAGSVGDAINGAVSEAQAAHNDAGSNDRAAALHGIAAAGDAFAAGSAVASLAQGGEPDIGVKVSIGTSSSQSQSSEDQTTQRGSSVQAGGTAAFVATNGDMTVAGSNVSANDVVLAAKNQVNIVNTTNTDSTRSSNSSSSGSVGVQYTLGGGFGISASMARAHGDANSDASIQNASHVNGANSVTIASGGDTNIIGSQVNGGQVSAAVGGNLNVASVQDVTNSAAHQSSVSGGFTISQGGGSANFSAQNGHADSSYAGVNEQAGINAGDGGFKINVKGNTALTGAVISSTADASQNSLTTGTLTYSDIQNHSHYDANSNGISAGVGVGSTGKAVGPGSVSGTGGVSPMISQNESGDQSATTRSAVSAGAINITNPTSQTQDVAGLSRDTTNTNGTVSGTPDVNTILSQQADTMQAAQAAGQVVAQGIGAYANSKQQAAQDAADAATKAAQAETDPDAKAADLALAKQDQAEADSWAEGGTNRVGLHVVGGALIGGLGGGALGAVGGAAGAGVSSALAGKLNGVADSIGNATGSMTVGNTVSNVLAGLSGALVGGSAGAFTASNADLYNRDTTNANGTGGTGSQFLDYVGDQLASAGRGAVNLAGIVNHALNQVIPSFGGSSTTGTDADALTGTGTTNTNPLTSQSKAALISQGVANGINAGLGISGGEPPVAPGTQAVPVASAGPVNSPGAAPGMPGYVPDSATLASGGNNNRLPIPDTVTADNGLQVESNPKHTAGMPGNNPNAGTEPSNSLDLFNSSIPGADGVRYAIDSNGNINRFYSDGNGVYHWSGSTGDNSAPLNVSKIPINVKRTLGFTGK
ncbi:hemagglutinin repeat-containing protein [Paraburkholderia sp. BR14262]|uniref:hemagglutinin repeat-containing protein n=2 Tax=unclassified Paraburkholderia TaxID=2615204 RepID=UPI0034CE0841